MTILTISANTKEEISIIQNVAKALKLKIKKTDIDSGYGVKFTSKMRESISQIESKQTSKLDMDDIWKL